MGRTRRSSGGGSRRRDPNIVLGVQIDRDLARQSVAALEPLDQKLEGLREGVNRLDEAGRINSETWERFSRILDANDAEWRGVERGILAVTDAQEQAARAARDHAEELEREQRAARDAARGADDYGAAWRTASERVEAFGDVDTSLMAVGGLLRSAGAGGAADVLGGGADIAAAVEGLGRLPTALTGVRERAIGAAEGVAQSATELLGLEVSAAAVGVAGGVAAAAVAAVGVALTLAQAEAQRGAERIRAYAERVRELNQALAEGVTEEEARSRRVEAGIDLDAALDTLAQFENDFRQGFEEALYYPAFNALAALNGTINPMTDDINEMLQVASNFGGEIGQLRQEVLDARAAVAEAGTTAADYGEAVIQGRTATNDWIDDIGDAAQRQIEYGNLVATSTVDSIQAQLDANQRQVEALEEARDGYAATADQSAQAALRLEETNQQLDVLYDEAELLTDALEAVNAAVLEAKAAEEAYAASLAIKTAAVQEATLLEDKAHAEAVAERRAYVEGLAEEAATLAEAASERKRLIDASAQRVTALTDAFDEFVDKAEDQIADVTKDLNKQTAKLNSEFLRGESQEWAQWALSVEHEAENVRLALLGIADRAQEDIRQAEERNSAIAYFEAQRRRRQAERETLREAGVEARQRYEEFLLERDQAKEAFQVRLADLKDAAADRIAEIREGIDREQALLDERIAEEESALERSLAQNKDAGEKLVRQQADRQGRSLQQHALYGTKLLDQEAKLLDDLVKLHATALGQTIAGGTGGSSKPLGGGLGKPVSIPGLPPPPATPKSIPAGGQTVVIQKTLNVGDIHGDVTRQDLDRLADRLLASDQQLFDTITTEVVRAFS